MQQAAWPSRARAYYALLILTLALMVATIDRGVLSVLVEYIKRDLHVSDTQFCCLVSRSYFSMRFWDCRSRAWRIAIAGA